ncbi:MAG: hypothetical protein V2I66_18285 [Halieaceae bacterium]|nr:hypothetical protein [Halieaceae bacterium]
MKEDTVDQNAPPPGLDPFVKRYLIALLVLLAGSAVYFLTQQDERVLAINEKLATAPELVDYPYRFRVLSLDSGVATVTSPRSPDMGPMHFLRVLDASLNDKDVLHPDMMAAQQRLAEVQVVAEALVLEEKDVSRIRWQLDEQWYREHGIFLPQ